MTPLSPLFTACCLMLLLQPAVSRSNPLASFAPTRPYQRTRKCQPKSFVSTISSDVGMSTTADLHDDYGLETVFLEQSTTTLQQQQQSAADSTASTGVPLYQLALAGALATTIGDAAMHPMDCIKTLQQSDEGMMLSFGEAAEYLFKANGIAAFYRGLTTYLVTDAGAGAVKFGVYEGLKKWILKHQRTFVLDEESQAQALYVCAGIAFIASSVILVPGELLKQQLQMCHYSTLMDATVGIFSEKGIPGFFAGYQGVCLRDVPYTMVELGLYDSLKRMYLAKNNNKSTTTTTSLSIREEILCAAVVGGIAGFLSTPLDTCKTKLMVDEYANVWQCLYSTISQHGIQGVFAGSIARVAWLMPFSAIYLPLFDAMNRQLMEWNNNGRGDETTALEQQFEE